MTTGAIGGEDAVSDRETQDWVPSEGDPPSLQENSISHKSTSNVVFGIHLKYKKIYNNYYRKLSYTF